MTQNLVLARRLAVREIVSRYRGAWLGAVWIIVAPIATLMIYLFVFTVVFEARWGGVPGERGAFGVVIFLGLTIYGFLSEVLTKATGSILSHKNYVTKVVFPLESIPVSVVLVALFYFVMNFSIYLIAHFFVFGVPSIVSLLFPVVFLPLVVFSIGAAFCVAAISTYVRDVSQVIYLGTVALLFLCPIFYPLESVPAGARGLMYWNPLTVIVENGRRVLIDGVLPVWGDLALNALASFVVLALGILVFQRLRKGFSDVV